MTAVVLITGATLWTQVQTLGITLQWVFVELFLPLLWGLLSKEYWRSQLLAALLTLWLFYSACRVLLMLWWLLTSPFRVMLWMLRSLWWAGNKMINKAVLSQEGIPGTEVMIMGAQVGMQFQEILDQQPGYCMWIISNVGSGMKVWNPQLHRLRGYLLQHTSLEQLKQDKARQAHLAKQEKQTYQEQQEAPPTVRTSASSSTGQYQNKVGLEMTEHVAARWLLLAKMMLKSHQSEEQIFLNALRRQQKMKKKAAGMRR